MQTISTQQSVEQQSGMRGPDSVALLLFDFICNTGTLSALHQAVVNEGDSESEG